VLWLLLNLKQRAQTRILIDVGHGGKDSGAIGINGIKEKDVVLDIALEILRQNENSEKPIDIYLTRYNDTLISLRNRTKLAKSLNADLFVSLHCNHSDNPNSRGVEVYVADLASKNSDDATWFAFQLQAALNRELGYESRGVKFANFQALRETIDDCPSVLLELGFLSNKDESSYIRKSENQIFTAKTILKILITKTNYD